MQFDQLKRRRELIMMLGGMAASSLACPFAVPAQQGGRIRHVGLRAGHLGSAPKLARLAAARFETPLAASPGQPPKQCNNDHRRDNDNGLTTNGSSLQAAAVRSLNFELRTSNFKLRTLCSLRHGPWAIGLGPLA